MLFLSQQDDLLVDTCTTALIWAYFYIRITLTESGVLEGQQDIRWYGGPLSLNRDQHFSSI